MVQAGEMGGFLDLVLGQISEFQTREKDLRGKVTAALIYPAVLLCLAIGVLIFLLTFFIPKFEPMFEGMGGSLPWITTVILTASHALTSAYAVFILMGALVIGVLLQRWLKTDSGRRAWEQGVLKTPVIGPLVARFALARFTRMLGTLLGAGVPLINSLRVACESIGHQGLMDAVKRSIERVRQGDRLGTSLSDTPELFPSTVLEIVSVAEESGRLDKELVRLAELTESDLDRQLRMAVSLAEPVLLFMMAAFIGTIFVGMVLPIFSMQDLVK
jgi:type II secretory pathway component PulF